MAEGKCFKTVAGMAEKELIIKKSKFICYVAPVESLTQAQEFVEEIRKKHWDATHNVPAWRVGFPVPAERFSDDGEPSGTAGMPVLEVLRKQELVNCVIVITRYFGGILLGAGGLVRAYTESAVEGLAQAGIKYFNLYLGFKLILDYPLLGQAMRTLEDLEAVIEEPFFHERVTVRGWISPAKKGVLDKAVSEITKGKEVLDWGEEKYM